MMSQIAFKKTTLLALLASSACAIALPAAAQAGPGGVSSPAARTPAPLVPAVRKAPIATWFGPGFYGHMTACGQILTPAVVGIANRTLPCGTLVRVSFHGRRLILPVIDRGPYANNGADWDLTTEAARTLGISDTVRIGARVVGSTPNTPTLGLSPGLPPSLPAIAATGGAAAN
jgi:rare lipoprotein A